MPPLPAPCLNEFGSCLADYKGKRQKRGSHAGAAGICICPGMPARIYMMRRVTRARAGLWALLIGLGFTPNQTQAPPERCRRLASLTCYAANGKTPGVSRPVYKSAIAFPAALSTKCRLKNTANLSSYPVKKFVFGKNICESRCKMRSFCSGSDCQEVDYEKHKNGGIV